MNKPLLSKGQLMSNETEVVIYARVSKPEGLQEADRIEHHSQLDNELADGSRCRVRATTVDDTTNYEFTFKVDVEDNGVDSCKEYNTPVDQAFYQGFARTAKSRVDKTRYIYYSDRIQLTVGTGDEARQISVPNIKYEVDVYTTVDGIIAEWCKIDVEVDAILDYLADQHADIPTVNLTIRIAHLPFRPTDAIVNINANEEQQAFIDSLWSTYNLPATVT